MKWGFQLYLLFQTCLQHTPEDCSLKDGETKGLGICTLDTWCGRHYMNQNFCESLRFSSFWCVSNAIKRKFLEDFVSKSGWLFKHVELSCMLCCAGIVVKYLACSVKYLNVMGSLLCGRILSFLHWHGHQAR